MPANKQSESKNTRSKKSNSAGKSPAKASQNKTKQSGSQIHEQTVKNPAVKKERAEKERNPASLFNQIIPYILAVFAIFIVICFISEAATGWLGHIIRTLLYGIFAGGAFAVPILIIVKAVFWKYDIENNTGGQRTVFCIIVLFFISILLHVIKGDTSTLSPVTHWTSGLELVGGGAAGGFIGGLLYKLVGSAGSIILSVMMLFIFGIFMLGLTPRVIWLYIAYYLHESKEKTSAAIKKNSEINAKRAAEHNAKLVNRPKYIQQPVPAEDPVGTPGCITENEYATAPISDINPYTEAKFEDNTAIESVEKSQSSASDTTDDIPEIDPAVFEEILNKNTSDTTEQPIENTSCTEDKPETETISPENTSYTVQNGSIDLSAIFTDPDNTDDEVSVSDDDHLNNIILEATRELELSNAKKNTQNELEIERGTIISEVKENDDFADDDSAPQPYIFPPITLLKADTSPQNIDISEELHTNATKLVETLNSFKVRTKILHVSRGPTITRYELSPEDGVRVRSIVNLVDDIALNLATSGVRIEAPIPGKQAVGIEVPNRNVSTVYLRELIEHDKFQQSQSRVTVSLGVDVANEPIFADIAKMPHLLIAGATGMGKSVCINSMIVSLLYKASPDDVKLILIDPKKVELSIYNGLPHLLVPVVSDPKKAAGSLHWAVTEMERRFELIEEAGVRDIKNYNLIAIDNPEMEYMPQVVIIIDELADLMMTASDDVEESICRLAQKARAAGMHLIIGTQRPSVDVITGLIKANIPSRIAFTVASQVDSRTIIDISGAEKLIGRGDMLYAPVGSQKPIRVQGAFVSEQEVEDICSFIKQSAGGVSYDHDVMDSIEKEAAKCGQGKKGGAISIEEGDESGEADPMLRPAIELAIESGKISTSLIQRRLSLGYGRAAKLIDEMEERGIVSEKDGQKPRNVLITKAQYMEMVLNKDDI